MQGASLLRVKNTKARKHIGFRRLLALLSQTQCFSVRARARQDNRGSAENKSPRISLRKGISPIPFAVLSGYWNTLFTQKWQLQTTNNKSWSPWSKHTAQYLTLFSTRGISRSIGAKLRWSELSLPRLWSYAESDLAQSAWTSIDAVLSLPVLHGLYTRPGSP
jgi:hypothetical protein